jgi:hypothetical protein
LLLAGKSKRLSRKGKECKGKANSSGLRRNREKKGGRNREKAKS